MSWSKNIYTHAPICTYMTTHRIHSTCKTHILHKSFQMHHFNTTGYLFVVIFVWGCLCSLRFAHRTSNNDKTIVTLLYHTCWVIISPFYTVTMNETEKHFNMPLESASLKNKVLSTKSCSNNDLLNISGCINDANVLAVQYE